MSSLDFLSIPKKFAKWLRIRPEKTPCVDNQLAPVQLVSLEPRVLYSAAPIPVEAMDVVDVNSHDVDPAIDLADSVDHKFESISEALSELHSIDVSVVQKTELVIIDTSVADYGQLVNDILDSADSTRQFQLAYLDSASDGVQQITDLLSQMRGLDAVHVVTHGADGELVLGQTRLNSSNLQQYETAVSSWRDSFNVEADLLFYGCDLASTADGLDLVQSLANLTTADIAASDDLTGHALFGGDWDFEYTLGDIGSDVAFSTEAQENWLHVLIPPTISMPSPPVDYVFGDPPTFIDPLATVVDPDSADFAAGQLSVTIDSGGDADDRLTIDQSGEFTLLAGNQIRYQPGGPPQILGTWAGGTDGTTPLVITLSAEADAADVQELLRNITYQNVSATPNNIDKVINVVLTDGDGGTSNVEVETIRMLDPIPIVDLDADDSAGSGLDYTTTYVHGSGGVLIADSDASISDENNATMSELVVKITTGYINGSDQLVFDTAKATLYGISDNWSAVQGRLRLSGTATIAQYEEILRSVAFTDLSGDPDPTNNRIVEVTIKDSNNNTSGIANTEIYFSKAEGLWLTTGTPLPGQGTPDLPDWGHEDILELSGPGLIFEPAGDSDGTISMAADMDLHFNKEMTSLHFVTRDITIGGGTDTVDLVYGDVLFSVKSQGTIGGIFVDPDDLVRYRSSDSSFQMVAENFTGNFTNVSAMTLVEKDTVIGDFTAKAGSFLFATTAGFEKNDIWYYEPTALGGSLTADPAAGSWSLLLEGDDYGLGERITGLDLIESDIALGGMTLQSGWLMMSTDATASVGDINAPIAVQGQDVFYLDISATTLIGGNANAEAILLVDGFDPVTPDNKVFLDTLEEEINGISLFTTENDPYGDATFVNTNADPVITSDGGGDTAAVNVAEGTTAVTTVTATDSDLPADTLTYSISGGDDAAFFNIDSSTGELSLVLAQDFELRLDSGFDGVYEVEVAVDDGNTGIDTQLISVTITNVNEAPEITSDGGGASASLNVAENTTAVTTVTATDADFPLDTLTYSISGGTDSTLFSIDSTTGELTFVSARDFETFSDADLDGVYEVEVTVDDGNGDTDIQAISVTITDANDAPVITSDGGGANATLNVAENTTAVTTVTSSDIDGGPAAYSISGGADSALFNIDSSTGELTFVSGRDFETFSDGDSDGVYQVEITADDGLGGTDVQMIDVTITDVNEAPVITSDGGGTTASLNVAENTIDVTTVTSSDQDTPGDTLTYSLSGGADSTLFNIDSSTGVLEFNSARDFETFSDADLDGVYEVQVTVDDGNGDTDVQAISVTITDANEAPVITSDGGGANAALNVAENTTTVTTVTSSDADGGPPAYSISGGADSALFNIDSSTGELTFVSGRDFETFSDGDSDGVYQVEITADDGLGGTDVQMIDVTITDVNEAPVITSDGGGTTASLNVAENTIAVTTVTSSDQDTPGDTLTYSLSGGADSTLFNIDSSTGVLEFNSARDFETFSDADLDGVYEVQVTVDDGNGDTDVQAISVTITDANEAPVITSDGGGANAALNVAENTTSVTTVTSSDADGGPPAYSISGGTDSALFNIDSSTGELTFVSGRDFETFSDGDSDGVYQVEITADDGLGGTDVQMIDVTITDVNEAPVITSDGGGTTASLNVAENTIAVTTVTSSDQDTPGDTLTYSLSGGADSTLFNIDSSTGVLEFNSARDFETFSDADLDGVYDVEVTVDDGNGDTDVQAISVTITDANEAPVITSDGGGANAALNVAENTTSVTTVTAIDIDDPPLTFTISGGDDASLFSIDSSTGELSFIAAPDFEVAGDLDGDNVYDVQVTVSDAVSLSDTQNIAVAVQPVNDNAPLFTTTTNLSIDEGTIAVQTVVATDADDPGDTITYSIVGGLDSLLFTIDSSTGVLEFITSPDFESPTDSNSDQVYEVTVRADDNVSLVQDQTILVTVDPVNEADPVFTTSTSFSRTENTIPGFTVNATDSDNPTVMSYSLAANPATDNSLFSIDSSSGNVTALFTANFELPLDSDGDNHYSIQVVANDGFGRTEIQTIDLEITDVDEFPTIGADSFSVDEAGTHNSAVGQLLINDIDADGLGLKTSLVNGPANGSLTLNNDGTFTYVHSGSETTTDSFEYAATNTKGLSTNGLVSITVNPVQDPTLTVDDNFSTLTVDPITITTASILSNDSDPDSTVLNVNAVSGSEVGGVVTIDAGGNLVFTPSAGFFGNASFAYVVVADGETSSPAKVNIVVSAAPTPDPGPVLPDPDPVPNPEIATDDEEEFGPQPKVAEAPTDVALLENLRPREFVDLINDSSDSDFSSINGMTTYAQLDDARVPIELHAIMATTETAGKSTLTGFDPILAAVFWENLDSTNEQFMTNFKFESPVFVAASAGILSLGFFAWMINGGMLLTSFASSVGGYLDPLPLVESGVRGRKDESDTSVEQMVDVEASDRVS